ncbi:uncharacterized protein UTRI_02536 [Ustilago trichophora]|uniref:Uncharacterized protein n=1 Tax=Ustilago trichophora TaxID=86804 RepID=A0A5C3E801_9BASI|nr:uncharacterized protein UTRI_02536 [Ustilago trichophora]
MPAEKHNIASSSSAGPSSTRRRLSKGKQRAMESDQDSYREESVQETSDVPPSTPALQARPGAKKKRPEAFRPGGGRARHGARDGGSYAAVFDAPDVDFAQLDDPRTNSGAQPVASRVGEPAAFPPSSTSVVTRAVDKIEQEVLETMTDAANQRPSPGPSSRRP